MMRRNVWFVAAALAVVGALHAQLPSDGAVRSGVYRNTFFKIEFTLPSILQAVDFSTLKLPPSANGREFGLMAAKKGNDPYGMVLIAETVGTGRGFFPDEEDFLRRVRVAQHLSESQKTVSVPSRVGPAFKELYFAAGGELNTAVVLRLDGHLLVWRCNAQSKADLDEMLAAIHGLHRAT